MTEHTMNMDKDITDKMASLLSDNPGLLARDAALTAYEEITGPRRRAREALEERKREFGRFNAGSEAEKKLLDRIAALRRSNPRLGYQEALLQAASQLLDEFK